MVLKADWVDKDAPGKTTPDWTFTAAAANSVAGQVNTNTTRLAELIYNVKAYGALGDGNANDTAAVQAAIDAASANYAGVVFFPMGVYKVTSLTLKSYVHLRGVGGGGAGSILRTAATSGDVLAYSDTLGLHGVTITDMRIEGPSSGTGNAIRLQNTGGTDKPSRNLAFRNMSITGFGGCGIQTDNLIVSVLDNITFDNCVTGLYLNTGTSVTVTACYAMDCGTGYNIKGMYYSTLNSPAADRCGTAYLIDTCSSLTLNSAGCEWSESVSPNDGFKITGSRDIVLNTPLTYGNRHYSWWITGTSTNITLVSPYEDTPSSATASVKVDTGSAVTLVNQDFTTAVSGAATYLDGARLGAVFSTADHPNADDRVCVQNTIDAAVAEILAAETDRTVLIHRQFLFATGVDGPAGFGTTNQQGVALPVNLPATLHIVFAAGAGITLSANCRNAFFIDQQAAYDVFQNVFFYNASVDGADVPVEGLQHGLVGNMGAGNSPTKYLSFDHIAFYGKTRAKFYATNTWDSDPDSVRGQVAIGLFGEHDDPLEVTQTYSRNIYLEDGDQEGGCGLFHVCVVGYLNGGTNHYHDNIIVDRYRYVNPDLPATQLTQTGIFICGPGFGDYCHLGPGYVENVGDDAIEIGAMQRIEIDSPRFKNPYLEGLLIRQSHAPIDVDTQKIVVRGLEHVATTAENYSAPIAVVIDNQVIELVSTASGGDFTLTVPGKGTTSALNYNATTGQIVTALYGIGCTGSRATGGPLNTDPVTVWVGNVQLEAPITFTSSLTGGTLTLTLSTLNASVGTITIEDPVVNISGAVYSTQSAVRSMIIQGLDQPVRKVEVIRPKVALTDYDYDGTGAHDAALYLPAAPYPRWGHLTVKDSETVLDNCDFANGGGNFLYFYEIGVEGDGTVVDVDGMISDRAGTNGTGEVYQIFPAFRGGSNVRVRARRLFPRTMSTTNAYSYVATALSSGGGTIAQFDVMDSDFSQGCDTGFTGAHNEYTAGALKDVFRTSRNVYNGSVAASTVYGTVMDGLVGTGSPEGAVTATVGSRYVATDGGAGTTLFVKTSGTGNTGWVGI